MIMPSDLDYKSTKKIKQNASQIKKEFKPLAKWIDRKYDVKTLNILFDYIQKDKSHPRIQICLEYVEDKEKFMNNKTYNYDKRKQKEIAEKFEELTSGYEFINKSNWIKKILGLTYKSNNLFVCFSDFESIAKIDANQSITKKDIKKLKSDINNEQLWKIVPRFLGVTYFFYTEEQIKKFQNSATHKKWNEQYFDLLIEYDEFNYIKKDNFTVYLDSKENFDTNFKSNWYYYFK